MSQSLLEEIISHTPRKEAILKASEAYAEEYTQWSLKKKYFQEEDIRYLQFLIPEGLRILDLGCGLGDKLSRLKPSYGVGIDFSPKTIEIAKKSYPHLDFMVGDIEDPQCFHSVSGFFDVILISDTMGSLEDCQKTLESLNSFCTPDTRLIISYYNQMWDPVLKLAEVCGFKFPEPGVNFLSTVDIANLLNLANFTTIKREWRILVPYYWYGLGPFINRFVATLPLLRTACLRNYIIARAHKSLENQKRPSTSVIITCRNEKGNVEPAVTRLPKFCEDLEIIFAEGHSQDGTLEEIYRVQKAYPEKNIRVCVQDGKGKGDAVRKGFNEATKDILMILDGDLTTPPEDMPKFYEALVNGKGEFINGTRLIYPMENQAMQFLNFLANKVFSWIFTYLLNQRFTDTLCGTKVLYKRQYQKISENRHYFGEFDPFGDFDLIFGASKLNLQVVEVPIRYKARTYGSTQISRFVHGCLLLKMVIFAYRKLKALG